MAARMARCGPPLPSTRGTPYRPVRAHLVLEDPRSPSASASYRILLAVLATLVCLAVAALICLAVAALVSASSICSRLELTQQVMVELAVQMQIKERLEMEKRLQKVRMDGELSCQPNLAVAIAENVNLEVLT